MIKTMRIIYENNPNSEVLKINTLLLLYDKNFVNGLQINVTSYCDVFTRITNFYFLTEN